jgi:hypothetical protein
MVHRGSVQELQRSLAERDRLIAALSERLHTLEDRFPPADATSPGPSTAGGAHRSGAQLLLQQSADNLRARSQAFAAPSAPRASALTSATRQTNSPEQLAERIQNVGGLSVPLSVLHQRPDAAMLPGWSRSCTRRTDGRNKSNGRNLGNRRNLRQQPQLRQQHSIG